jgi:hypothetical protein
MSELATETPLYLALFLSRQVVRAALWAPLGEAADVRMISASQTYENQDDLAKSIDVCLQELGEESESVKKILFFITDDWAERGAMIASKRPAFEKAVADLGLEPLGYIVVSEAMAQHVRSQPGAHVFAERQADQWQLSTMAYGQLGATDTLPADDSAVPTMLAHFQRLQAEHEAVHALLFTFGEDSESLEGIVPSILAGWTAKGEPPSIEVWPVDRCCHHLLQIGAQAVSPPESAESGGTGLSDVPMAIAEGSDVVVPSVPLAELANEEEDESAVVTETQNDSLGIEEESPVKTAVASPRWQLSRDRRLGGFGTALFGGEGSTSRPARFSFKKLWPIALVVGLLLGLTAATVSAKSLIASRYVLVVKVTPKSQTLTQNATITADPKATRDDPTTGVLRATLIKTVIEGQESGNATGKTEAGEKAKGVVTVFNRTLQPKTFDAGTKLKKDSLEFLLENSVSIASASTGSNFETQPATKDVQVVAVQPGTGGNLSKDTQLAIDSFSSDTYVARVKDALSGGSSKEVAAVTKKDRDVLLQTLRIKLASEGAKQLQADAASGTYVVSSGKDRVVSASFSAEVGKAASEVSLKMKLEAEGIQYQASAIRELSTQRLQQLVPSGFQIKGDPEVLSAPQSTTATAAASLKLDVNIQAKAVAQLTADDIRNQIAGKSLAELETALTQTGRIEKFETQVFPQWFTRWATAVPADASRVTIQVVEP